MNFDNIVFIGGMDNDNNPSFVKKGDYIYALNAVQNSTYSQGKYILSNEEGFSEFTDFLQKYPKDIILNVTNIENVLIVFSIVVDNNLNTRLSRIGYIKDGQYYEVLNDDDDSYWINNKKIDDYKLKFHIDYQIQTFARKAYNNDIIVYWVDERNAPRYLNISKNYKELFNRFKNIDLETRIFTKYDKPDTYIEDIIVGGELMAGSYNFVCRYVTKDGRESDWGLISNNVYIVKNDEKKHLIEGANFDYGFINKSIKLRIINIDNGYDYLEVAVIRYTGNASTIDCFIFERINIKGIDKKLYVIFDGKKKIRSISIDDILRKNVYYEVANVISHKDNRLFLANLKASDLIDLQPIANDLIFKWGCWEEPYLSDVAQNYDDYNKLFKLDDNGENLIQIQEPLWVSRGLKGFQREEAYSLGIVGIDAFGDETFAFHVPAKLPKQVDSIFNNEWSPYNLIPVDENNPQVNEANKCKAQVYPVNDGFNTYYRYDKFKNNTGISGVCGVYFSEETYNDKGVYFDINGNDLYGKRIRHWLMPSYNMSPHFHYNYDESKLYLRPLHLFIPRDHLKQLYYKHRELFKKIKKLLIVRQKRDTPQKRGIYYMGLVNPMLIQDGFSKLYNGYTNQRSMEVKVTPDGADKFALETQDRGKSAVVCPFHGNTFIYDEDKVCFFNGRFTYEWLYKEFERNRLIYNNSTKFSWDYNTYANANSLQTIDVYSYYEHILRHADITRGSHTISLLSNEGIDPFDNSNPNAGVVTLTYTTNINNTSISPTDRTQARFSHFGFLLKYKLTDKVQLTSPRPDSCSYELDKYSACNKAKWYNAFLYKGELKFDNDRADCILKDYYTYYINYICVLWYSKYCLRTEVGTYIEYFYSTFLPHLYAWSGVSSEIEGKKNIAFYSPETLFYDDIYIPINSQLKPVLEVMSMPYRVNDMNYTKPKYNGGYVDYLETPLANGDLGFIKYDGTGVSGLKYDEFADENRDVRAPYFHIHHNWFFHVGEEFNNNKTERNLSVEIPNVIYLEYNDYKFNFSYKSNTYFPSKNYDRRYSNSVIYYQFVHSNDIVKSVQDYNEKLKYFLYETNIKINNYDGERYLYLSIDSEIVLPELMHTYYVLLGNSLRYEEFGNANDYDNDILNNGNNTRVSGWNNIICNNLFNFPNFILDWGLSEKYNNTIINSVYNPYTITTFYPDLHNNSSATSKPVGYYFLVDRRIKPYKRDLDNNGLPDDAVYSNRYIYIIDSFNKSQYGTLDNNDYILSEIIYNDIDFEIKDNDILDGVHFLSYTEDNNYTFRISNGDVYVSMFYYRNSIRLPFYYEYGKHTAYGGYGRLKTREGMELRSGNFIPIESEVNCFYRHRPIQKDNNGKFIGYGVRYYPLCSEKEALNPESEEATNVNYNPQYSFQNDKKVFFLYPRNIQFQQYFRNRIIYSNLHVEGSVKDNFLLFNIDSYQDIQKDKGEITNLFKLGNDMYAQTKMSLFKLFVNPYEALNQSGLILTTSGVFQRPAIEIQSGISNNGGTYHKFSGVDTQYGYYFVDFYSKKVYLFNNTLEEISLAGMSNFFNNVLDFEAVKNGLYHNLSNPNGIGIYSIYDKTNQRIITTIKYGEGEKDYYTISFNLLNKRWTSFHSYKLSVGEEYLNSFVITDNIIGSNRLLYGKGGEHGSYLRNNKEYFIIEFVFNKDFQITKVFDNLVLDLEILNIDRDTSFYIESENRIKERIAYDFFDYMECYTSYQNTGIVELIVYNPNDINSNEILSNVKYYNNQYNIKLQNNMVYDSERYIFDSQNLKLYDNFNRLKDKYVVIKLVYKNLENLLFLLKQCILKYRINVR
jgi:hypothetical protein